MSDWTAVAVMDRLRERGLVDPPDGRHTMRDLFAVAKAAEAGGMALAEVDGLMTESSYAARMAAFCVLDFRARRGPGEELCAAYLGHHDRIDAWDMVDRAAPWCVGAAVAGGPYSVVTELAGSADPLRRRTAMTAPLWWVRHGSDADLTVGFEVAEALHGDPDPVVHKPVGIFLAHAGDRDREALLAFLERHEPGMARPAARLARRKLG